MSLTRELGSTGIEVTRLCAGAAHWRSPDDPEGGIDPAESAALADALFRSEVVRYLDTSNNYAGGESERRIGLALRAAGGIPAGFVLQTKADRDMSTGDFSGSRMRASIAESLDRLGLTRLPILFLHDPENTTWEQAMAADGPVAALVAARDEGLIGHLGLSGGPVRPADPLPRDRLLRGGHHAQPAHPGRSQRGPAARPRRRARHRACSTRHRTAAAC